MSEVHEYDADVDSLLGSQFWLRIQYATLAMQAVTVGSGYYLYFLVAGGSKTAVADLVETGVPAALGASPLGQETTASLLLPVILIWVVLEVAGLPLAMWYHGKQLNRHGGDVKRLPAWIVFSWKYPIVGVYYVWKRRQAHQEVFNTR